MRSKIWFISKALIGITKTTTNYKMDHLPEI